MAVPAQVYNRHDRYEWQQRITWSLLQHWYMNKLVQQEPFEGVLPLYSFAIKPGGRTWPRARHRRV